MEWESVLLELMDLVKNTAPALWEVALRQVGADAMELFIIFAALVGLAFASWRVNRWCSKKLDDKGYDFDLATGRGISLISMCFIAFVSLMPLTKAIKYLINPDYYAIKILLELLK